MQTQKLALKRKTKLSHPPVEVVIHHIPWEQIGPVQRVALVDLAQILFRPLPDEQEGQVENEAATSRCEDGLIDALVAETKPAAKKRTIKKAGN
ncbi:MAG: hypothetical protein HY011_08720 [Acidobacteria bacterium]|nr:hypothetical protein [Acidobacteriota bacterium]